MKQTAGIRVKKKGVNPFDEFLQGAREGWDIGVKMVIPSIMMSYIIIRIFKITGILDLISAYCGPIMMLFGGLPGAAMIAFIAGFFSKGGGTASAALLFAEGSLSASDCAILLPVIMSCGGLLNQWLRVVCVAGTAPKRQGWMFLIALINGVLSAWIMRFVMMIL